MQEVDDYRDMFDQVDGELNNFRLDVGDALGDSSVTIRYGDNEVAEVDQARIEKIAGECFIIGQNAVTVIEGGERTNALISAVVTPVSELIGIHGNIPSEENMPEGVAVDLPGMASHD